MRRVRVSRLVLAGSLAALAAGLLPGAAAAAPSGPTVKINLERGRYHVNVGNRGETVMVTVETGAVKSQRRVATASYAVHGSATESRLEADFGKLGEISMRFHPSRHRTWVKPDRDCRGPGELLVRRGSWRGKLRFRGEGGYLSLDLHRARGSVATVAPECRGKDRQQRARERRSGRHGSHQQRLRSARPPSVSDRRLVAPTQESELGPEVPVLKASWRQGVAAAQFIAGAGKEGSVFFAATEEARGRVAIFRSARAEARSKLVRANNALTRAKLTTVWPFHRSARYRAAPDGSRTWSGWLYASFPGAPRYPLTGEPFEPSLAFFPELLIGLIGLSSR